MLGRKQLVTFTFATLVAAAVMSPALGAVRPDDRAGPLGAQPARITAVTSDRSDVFTRAVARHGSTAPAAISVSTSSAAGFHWFDAGIGAAAGVVACLTLVFAAGRLLRPNSSATAH